jgi:DNA (cytosine-5)-methyltransferase 1
MLGPNPEVTVTDQAPLKLLDQLAQRRSIKEIAAQLHVSERTLRRWLKGETRPPGYLADSVQRLLVSTPPTGDFRFIDLFAGIGGIRAGFDGIGGRCVYTSEWDKYAQRTYAANFVEDVDHRFVGDITQVDADDVPDHDVLLAGFPCQPFSIAGVSKKNALGRAHGFADETQGTLFFDVARIIDAKRPRAFLLENVRNLKSHDRGRTFEVIRHTLEEELDYNVTWKVMDARSWVPQGRQRILIVGFDRRQVPVMPFDFDDVVVPRRSPTMSSILHPEDGSEAPEAHYTVGDLAEVDPRYTLTPKLWDYLQNYAAKHRSAGNGFGFGLVGADSVARTLSARYYKDGSEILVDQGLGRRPRRLTPRECARLMGFPDDFRITVSDTQAYRQFGNSVVAPMIASVARAMQPHIIGKAGLSAAS